MNHSLKTLSLICKEISIILDSGFLVEIESKLDNIDCISFRFSSHHSHYDLSVWSNGELSIIGGLVNGESIDSFEIPDGETFSDRIKSAIKIIGRQ